MLEGGTISVGFYC